VAGAIARALMAVVEPWIDDTGPQFGTQLDDDDLAGLANRDRYGAGLTKQRHHLKPQELAPFYEARGFDKGEIHRTTIELSEGEHQAIHGGGSQRLARNHWPEGSWNERLKIEYAKLEKDLGRPMTREEIEVHERRMRADFKVNEEPVVPFKGPR
jgi:hypothetical protein